MFWKYLRHDCEPLVRGYFRRTNRDRDRLFHYFQALTAQFGLRPEGMPNQTHGRYASKAAPVMRIVPAARRRGNGRGDCVPLVVALGADAPREPRGGLDKSALLTGEAPLAGHFVGHPGR